jgi:23S rRNA pseudouridine1911/1915/1917 synthase
LPEYSRSRLQEWVVQGQVTLNGAPATIKQKVWGGEAIVLVPQSDPADQPYLAEDIPLDIVYEDDSILIINKPVGLVVHPGSGNWEGTLLNALLHHAPHLAEVPRAGIVHRLDKDTSGLLVVAKTIIAQTDLVRQLQARTVSREYLALVHGEVARGGRVDAPIDRHPSQRTKMAVVEGGKPAVTHYAIVESFGCPAALQAETGRTPDTRASLTATAGRRSHLHQGPEMPAAEVTPLPPFQDRLCMRSAQGCIRNRRMDGWQVDMPGTYSGY